MTTHTHFTREGGLSLSHYNKTVTEARKKKNMIFTPLICPVSLYKSERKLFQTTAKSKRIMSMYVS